MTKIVGIDNDLMITDDLQFVLRTTDHSDLSVRPYRINDVTIYFVTREFTDTTVSEYSVERPKQEIQKEYDKTRDEISLRAKKNVRVATTENISLSGLGVVDGVALQEGDRVLVKNQSDGSQNGIYVSSSSAANWARSHDADSDSEVFQGIYVFVDEGEENMGCGWYIPGEEELDRLWRKKIVLGVSSVQFRKFAENGKPAVPDEKSQERLARFKMLTDQLASSKTKSSFFYKDALAVKIFGGYAESETNEYFPAWLNPDMVPSELRSQTIENNMLRESDENPGTFFLNWSPSGCREGDYFVCWSWRPTLGDEVLSSHILFSLGGNTALTTSIPTHYTPPDKYETLMERYMPEMFKSRMVEADLSPEVLGGLNGSVAKGFTFLEDLANQIVDLLDANSTHEQLLPLLSNLFNLKLKSNDPTLWRRQIKKAMPQFKRKGTIEGLKEALGDIGMKFIKFTRLWQVVSEYTHHEHFDYQGSNTFDLSKSMILPVDSNFGLWYRHSDGEWEEVDEESATFSSTTMTWLGELEKGDSVRVLYKIKEIPNPTVQETEDYIRILPLMDDRDERGQEYPKKNWNSRLIEEDHPYFDAVIPTRHPMADFTVWGKIRTEFPYSENAYNMDEYNGSKRDSLNPCDIDIDFVDGCTGCLSSKFNLDIEADMLSDGSFQEARQIVDEYMPFHALPNTFNFYGSVNEFIVPSMEKIEAMVTYSREEVLLAGEGQKIFNRSVDSSERPNRGNPYDSSEIDNVKRGILASFHSVVNPDTGSTDWSGTLKNQYISLFPSVTSVSVSSSTSSFDGEEKTHGFDSIGVNTTNVSSMDAFENDNLLEIIGSSTYEYSIARMSRSAARIKGDVEPSLVGPVLEYRISNKISDALNIDIEQADKIVFSDPDTDFTMYPVVTQNDIDSGLSLDNAWVMEVDGSYYVVFDALPDGTLILSSLSESPSSGSGLSWTLRSSMPSSSSSSPEKSGSNGSLTTYDYGLATVNSESGDIREFLKVGDYVYSTSYSSSSSSSGSDMWRIRSFKRGSLNQFFIEDYEDGTQPLNVRVYRRILENKVGQIGYEGLILEGSANLESKLAISNGHNYNPSDIDSANLKENFLIFTGSEGGGNLRRYTILDIDGSVVTLGGPMDDYSLDGQSVTFIVYKFTKENLTLKERTLPVVPGHEFNAIDRSGGTVITETGGGETLGFLSMLLNSAASGQPVDVTQQSESINFNIEYKE